MIVFARAPELVMWRAPGGQKCFDYLLDVFECLTRRGTFDLVVFSLSTAARIAADALFYRLQ